MSGEIVELPGVDEFYGFRAHAAAAELFLELPGKGLSWRE